MAGHSKFKNIMYRKGAQDKKRSAMFSKLSREITVAAKSGVPDPDMNPRLRSAVLAARAQSMPKDNIERAINKASSGEGDNYEEIRYEGFGPGGVGVIVECLTDNKNRTAGEVRAAFTKSGGNLGETNSVSFSWKKLGEVRYVLATASEDAMLEAAIEAGADDCAVEGEHHVITCEMAALVGVSQALAKKFGDPTSAKFVWRTDIAIPVEGDNAEALMKLLDQLDDLDDVQDVYSNEDISDAELARLSA